MSWEREEDKVSFPSSISKAHSELKTQTIVLSLVGLAKVVLHEIGHNMGMGHQGRNKECLGKGKGGMIKAALPAGQVWTECNKDDFFYHYQLVTQQKGLEWCMAGE